MAKVADVEILVRANVQLASDLAKAKSQLEKFSKDSTSSFRSLGDAVKGAFGLNLAQLGTVAGVGLLARELKQATVAAFEFASEIRDTAANVGISTTSLQELRFAAKQSGIGIESLDQALVNLNQNLSEAFADRNSSAALVFEQIGFNVRDANGEIKKADPAFREIIARVKELGSASDRIDINKKIFGRPGAELSKLTSESAESLEELTRQAHSLGVVINEETVVASEKLADRFSAIASVAATELKVALLGLGGPLEGVATAMETGVAMAADYLNIFKQWASSGGIAGAAADVEKLKKAVEGTQKRLDDELSGFFRPDQNVVKLIRQNLNKQIAELEAAQARLAKLQADFELSQAGKPLLGPEQQETGRSLPKVRDPQAEARARADALRRAQESVRETAAIFGDAQKLSEEWARQVDIDNKAVASSLEQRLQAEAELAEALGNTNEAEAKRAALVKARFDRAREETTKTVADLKDRAAAIENLNAAEGATLAKQATDAEKAFEHLKDFGVAGLSDALADLAITGKLTFASLGQSFLREFIQVAINKGVKSLVESLLKVANSLNTSGSGGGTATAGWVGALGSIFSSFFGGAADGKIFMKPSVTRIAEKRPEVALSAAQLRDFAGGGGSSGIEITVNNHGPTPASAEVTRGANGQVQIEIMVAKAMLNDVRTNGPHTQALAQTFAITRAGGRNG